MIIAVNDTPTDLPDHATVADLLEHLGKTDTPCAVERNGELVPWRDHDAVALQPDDSIEIVTLVGGG
ncbi:MAG: sulfur carrier protein ThiS [Phycisphaerales bacterium]|nr:sulfur carrier protein ThiS [Phycisphaerales bacterium]MDP6889940.1 sulfur carrier protein ThiS [Phycisphaerales bacterium]